MLISDKMDQAIRSYIEENRDAAVDFYRTLVNLEGRHGEKDCLLKTAEFLRSSFEEAGLRSELLYAGETNAPVVSAVLNENADGKAILFTGHYDTVFAAGSRGSEPFSVDEEGKAHGPGVCDMKGGITIAFFTVKALQALGFDQCPVRLFFVGDEEVNHQGGCAAELIRQESEKILVAFNMEHGLESGEVCIGRPGCYEYKLVIHGVSSHPGHAYDAGRNAIQEMSHKVIALQNCTPKEKDRLYSVSVNTIRGGSAVNCIADYCEAMIDVRVRNFAALEECERKMQEACSQTFIEGTRTELVCTDAMMPFETTPQVESAYASLKRISDAVGGPVTGAVFAGGACDASYFAREGVKILCMCGIRGNYNHNINEYGVISSIYEWMRLYIYAAYNYREFV